MPIDSSSRREFTSLFERCFTLLKESAPLLFSNGEHSYFSHHNPLLQKLFSYHTKQPNFDLFIAIIIQKDPDDIEAMMAERNLSPTSVIQNNYTPCYIAAMYGNAAILERWIEKGYNPDDNILHLVARYGHHNAMRVLLSVQGIKVNVHDKYGYTPLHLAARHGHLQIVQMLAADSLTDINCAELVTPSPFALAVQKGRIEIILFFLNNPTLDVYQSGSMLVGSRWCYYTPLEEAIAYKQYEAMRILLKSEKINPNKPSSQKTEESEMTALQFAAKFGDLTTIEILLEVPHICLKETNVCLSTPLQIAAYNINQEIRSKEESYKIIKKFLSLEGLDVNHKRIDYGDTALSILIEREDIVAIKLLLADPRVEVNYTDNFGSSPLHIAAQRNNPDIIRALVEHPKIEISDDPYIISQLERWDIQQRAPIIEPLLLSPQLAPIEILENPPPPTGCLSCRLL